MSKLILGTAQFGSDYGIKHDGQPSYDEIRKIAKIAWNSGVRTIHTSWQYGLSEETKTIFSIFEKIEKDRMYPSMFHYRGLRGLSLYDPPSIGALDAVAYEMPVNVLDRRFHNFMLACKKVGLQIHARSVFLQGLLLMELSKIPFWVNDHALSQIEKFHIACKEKGLELYEGALGWVLGQEELDGVIIGVNSASQLEQLLGVKPLKWEHDFSIIGDDAVLDPRKWPKE